MPPAARNPFEKGFLAAGGKTKAKKQSQLFLL